MARKSITTRSVKALAAKLAAQRAADAKVAIEAATEGEPSAPGSASDEAEETPAQKFDRIGRETCVDLEIEYDELDPHPTSWDGSFLWKRRQMERAFHARVDAWGEPTPDWPADHLQDYMTRHGIKNTLRGPMEMDAPVDARAEELTGWWMEALRRAPAVSADAVPRTYSGAVVKQEYGEIGVGLATLAQIEDFFRRNPQGRYVDCARAISRTVPVITAAKQRVLARCKREGTTPPAWTMRKTGPRQK